MKKILLLITVFMLASISFAAEITDENYQWYIGKRIEFNPKASDPYKIGRKTFDNKKYSGVVLTVADIEQDKKGNLIIFLTQALENGKTKEIKIKAKAPQAVLQNIIVIEDVKPQKKEVKSPAPKPVASSQAANRTTPLQHPAPASNNINNIDDSSESSFFIWFIVIGFIVAFFVFIYGGRRNDKKMSIEVVNTRSTKVRTYWGRTDDEKLIETVTTRSTNSHTGASAERDLVLKLLKTGIPAEMIFHDLYLEKPSGGFRQIDVIAVTDAGIIVFEVKDYNGWIFGNGKHSQWTQVLAYGKQKHRFYNPVMQNHWHVTALQKQLKQFAKVPFYSVIVFFGDCELKDITFIPKGTFIVTEGRIVEVVDRIISTNVAGYYINKDEVIRVLKTAVKNGNTEETQNKHIEKVKDMLGKDRIFR